jgi:hypothetical protein
LASFVKDCHERRKENFLPSTTPKIEVCSIIKFYISLSSGNNYGQVSMRLLKALWTTSDIAG